MRPPVRHSPASPEAIIPSERARAALPVLFSVVVIDLIGFGIVVPVLPFYADAYGADGTTLGLLVSSYAGAQFLCSSFWGRLSDRIGRRPVMLLTIAGTAVSLLLLGLADSLTGLFAARFLGGAFAANISVASAYLADVTAEDERTRWMGVLGACFGVGFLLGPAIGGLLAPFGYAVPMLVAAGLAAANWVHAALSLREPARHAASAPPVSALPLRELFDDPRVRLMCLANFTFAAAVTQLETMFPFFMKDRFGYDASDVAWLLVAMAALMGAIQGGGIKSLVARFGERTLVISGCTLLAVAFLWLPLPRSVGLLLLPLAAAAVGRAVSQPSLMGLVSIAALSSQRGAVMGAFQASASLARVVAPLVAGVVYDRSMDGPFVLGGALLLGVALMGRRLPRPRPATLAVG